MERGDWIMAAPSGTTWGSTVGSYGRIGLYTSLSSTNTQTTLTVQIWFWSKYSVSDTNNTLYYNNRASSGSATTSKGDVSISTTVDSGSGWSTSNQKKLKTYTVTYDRDTSAKTRYLYAKLAGVDRVGGTMYASKTVSIPKLPSYTVSYNANGGTGVPDSQIKYYGQNLTLSSTIPTRAGYTFKGWGSSASATSPVNHPGGTYTGNAAYTYYAIWQINTYAVSYDANGGTGAPANQTKTYGKTLVLSTTKPTRTGYDFKGWGVSSSDTSVDYDPGDNYTNNAAVTLYAIWSLKTYTIKYDANGGTGAPANQTKTHDIAIALSTTIPTRAEYVFKGWSTSPSSTTASYQPGYKWTTNSGADLYAVWEIAYKKPTISNVKLVRCDMWGQPVGEEVEKSSAQLDFEWSTFYPATSLVVSWESNSGGISGSQSYDVSDATVGWIVNFVFGNDEIPMDQTFTITITLSDSGGSTSLSYTLEGYIFPIDMLGGGKGVAFGKPAEYENLADFAFQANFGGGIKNQLIKYGTDLNNINTPNVYCGNTPSDNGYLNCPVTSASFTLEVLSAGSEGQLMQRYTTCDKTSPKIYVRHYYQNSWGSWITM